MEQTAENYDGAAPFPDAGPAASTVGGPLQVAVAAAITGLPFAGLVAALWLAWGHGVGLTDLMLMAGLYAFTGLGVTLGFHRCFTHRSFTAAPVLRVVLAVAGSMSFQGDVVGWVATHRRHHAFAEKPGDPHSPYRHETSLRGLLRGLLDAHLRLVLPCRPHAESSATHRTCAQIPRYAPYHAHSPRLRALARGAVRTRLGDRRHPLLRADRAAVGLLSGSCCCST